MRMLRRIKVVIPRDNVKILDIREELGVNNADMDICSEWTNRTIVDMIVPGKRPRGRWMDCRNCGSPRTEHSGNPQFGPVTPPSGKRRRGSNRHTHTIGLI